ncbi:methyltransferase [Streptomonospora arabica]
MSGLMAPVFGYAFFQIAHTAASVGVPEAIGESPATVEEIAAATRTDPAHLSRLLRSAAAAGLLTLREGGRYEVTALGRLLREDSPSQVKHMMALHAAPAVWQAWARLEESVRTGRPAFELAHGADLFDHLETDPELAQTFHRAMAASTSTQIPALVAHYDFGDFTEVVDLAGGNGTHLAAILAADDRISGTLADTAQGLSEASSVLGEAGVADRCTTAVSDVFESVPAGRDLYLLKNVLPDWDDESCTRILRNCREAMAPGGAVKIIASLVPEDPRTIDGGQMTALSFFDISLMTLTSGRERTLGEYEELLAKAGLRLREAAPIPDTAMYHEVTALAA